MRKLQKPLVAEAKTSKKKPLAEGLQIEVPTDSQGRRLWSKMSDKQITEYARRVVGEKGIIGRTELSKADTGLYQVLRKKQLLDNVGFEERYRSWRDMEDEEIVELARKLMEERGISGKKELERSDTGLHSVLRARGLLDEVGFKQKRRNERSWKDMSDEEIVEYARKVIEENKIISRRKLRSTDGGLYFILYRRGLLDRAFARIDQQKTDQARDAVIDALEAFTVANDNAISEDDVA